MMASRGRPPYPDILTPREWEVLHLLRENLSNAQIAERLGITERTAKFHVSEILAKLGLASREEAATWSPLEQKRRWLRGFHWPIKWALMAKIGGATAVAAAAGGVALLAWGVSVTDSPTSDGQSASHDDATLAAMAGLTLPTCAPLDATAEEVPADCIPGYSISYDLTTEELYYFPGRIGGGCSSDPPRDPIPRWECHKLFPLWRDNLRPPPQAFLPEPPEGVKGDQCKEPEAADTSASVWLVGDTCYDWTFDYDRKTWHCWAVYLRDQQPEARPADAGCVGVLAFADDWPDGLPTPPAGVDRMKWWCEQRAVSPDFVKSACSILDLQAATGADGR
jgi:DNA-binding CsgD family transcriptional regulator